MKKLIINLISICMGIFIWEYITDQDYIQAIEHSYWALFGGLFVGLSK